MKTKASEKKVAANRANALRSSGPKSKIGKQKSSLNALKHGAYATSILIFGEDKTLYDALKKEQRKRYPPKSFVEEALISQLVNELWNLRRINQAEQIFQSEVQQSLPLLDPSQLTDSEAKLLEQAKIKPRSTSRRLAEAHMTLSDNSTEELSGGEDAIRLQKTYRGLQDKVTRVGEVYANIFLYSSRERMEKIMSLRRSCLQNILGIERELERRRSSNEPADEPE